MEDSLQFGKIVASASPRRRRTGELNSKTFSNIDGSVVCSSVHPPSFPSPPLSVPRTLCGRYGSSVYFTDGLLDEPRDKPI